MSKQIKSFVKSFIALVQGDDTTVLAEKVYRQANSALKTQISSLEGDTVTFEEAVTDAKEALGKSRLNNGNPIEAVNRNSYVANLISARNRVVTAEETLEAHLEKLDFLKNELVELDKDAEVEA